MIKAGIVGRIKSVIRLVLVQKRPPWSDHLRVVTLSSGLFPKPLSSPLNTELLPPIWLGVVILKPFIYKAQV